MANRLIDIMGPADNAEHLRSVIVKAKPVSWWMQEADGTVEFKVIVPKEAVEGILDSLESYMAIHEGIAVVVLDAAATLPRIDQSSLQTIGRSRISREELYNELSRGTSIDAVYITTVALSTILAAIGLYRNSPAIIIGAMVIAPLMGPNMALALATTLGDTRLAFRSLKANAAGVGTAFVLAFVIGILAGAPSGPEIAARIRVDLGDIGLALASGTAGALAFTSGVSAALVGVMVAVALLPPLVVLATLLANGTPGVTQALELLAINLIGINIAGVATFLARGIRPRTWWEEVKAKRATRIALVTWIILLILLVVLVLYSSTAPLPR